MSQVVVTGGAGFLGSHVVDALAAEGHSVRVFDQRRSPHFASGPEMVVGDLLDRSAVDDAVRDADYVYHLAALSDLNAARTLPASGPKSCGSPRRGWRTGCSATITARGFCANTFA